MNKPPWWHLDHMDVTPRQQYLIGVCTSFSRFFNALTGGDHRESVCSRANRRQEEGSVKWWLAEEILDVVFMEPGHCYKARHMPDRRVKNG